MQHVVGRVESLSMIQCGLSDDAGVYLAYGILTHSSSREVYRSSNAFSGIKVLILNQNNISDEAA